MRTKHLMLVLMAVAAVAVFVTEAQAFRITTNDAGGADCELREIADAGTVNRGTSTEIASRVASNRNSLVYLKFGVADISAADLLGDITVRTTYRNNNLVESRFENPSGGPNAGWDYYVLDPAYAGANWGETAITTQSAPPPGYFYDGLADTKACGIPDFPSDGLTYLGQQLYSDAGVVGTNRHLPVGGAFDFTLGAGSLLHNAIVAAQATDHQTLTIVMSIAHDYTTEGVPAQWLGFNYLFNPKEMARLNLDPDSPWTGLYQVNNDYAFSPQLTNEAHIPEPATLALLGLGSLLLRRRR